MAGENGQNFGNVELSSGLGEKELRWSYWWVNHREGIRKISVAIFMVVDAILVLYGLWGFIDYLALSGVKEELAIRQFTVNGRLLGGGQQVQEVQLDAPIVFSVPGDKYDLLVPVSNPNASYWISLDYRFDIGAYETPVRHGFVLPGQSKYLAELGVKPDERPNGSNVTLKVTGRVFHHLDRHQVGDYEGWSQSRLGIEATDAQFVPADPSATVPVSHSTFNARNHTAFSYYDVDLLVLLYRSDAIVGVNRYRLGQLKAGETRPIDLSWFGSLPQVSGVKVFPDINILDPNAYATPGT